MKNLILAAFAAPSLSAAIVSAAYAAAFRNGSTTGGDALATRQHQTGSFGR